MKQKLDSLSQKQKIVLGGACLFLLLIAIFSFMNRAPENAARPDQLFNVGAFGMLPPLEQAVKNNGRLNNIIQEIVTYDEVYLFVNYKRVNSKVATALFLWADISEAELQRSGSQSSIATFIRRAYGLPDDELILNNPLLEDNPWGDLFNRFKAQILMQGQGHKIYDGLAYFDNENDQMIIDANISKDFVQGFSEFLKTQDAVSRKKYINNFLLFIRDTKGFRSLSDKDKELIKQLQVSQ